MSLVASDFSGLEWSDLYVFKSNVTNAFDDTVKLVMPGLGRYSRSPIWVAPDVRESRLYWMRNYYFTSFFIRYFFYWANKIRFGLRLIERYSGLIWTPAMCDFMSDLSYITFSTWSSGRDVRMILGPAGCSFILRCLKKKMEYESQMIIPG